MHCRSVKGSCTLNAMFMHPACTVRCSCNVQFVNALLNVHAMRNVCTVHVLFNVHAMFIHWHCGQPSSTLLPILVFIIRGRRLIFLFFTWCDKCTAQKEDKKVQSKGLKSGSCLFSESLDYLVWGDSSRIHFLKKELFDSFIFLRLYWSALRICVRNVNCATTNYNLLRLFHENKTKMSHLLETEMEWMNRHCRKSTKRHCKY
jgi:hypothetical protein